MPGGADFDTILASANGSRLGISSITGIEEIASAGFANFTIELQLNTTGGPSAPTIDLSKTLLSGVTSIEGTSRVTPSTLLGLSQETPSAKQAMTR